jgi:hypothetical protein
LRERREKKKREPLKFHNMVLSHKEKTSVVVLSTYSKAAFKAVEGAACLAGAKAAAAERREAKMASFILIFRGVRLCTSYNNRNCSHSKRW